LNQSEPARPTRRYRSRQVASAAERFTPPRVTVSWSPSNYEGASGESTTEVQLVAELEAASGTMWTCPNGLGSNWVEAISTARCSEVVLTARLGDDPSAKHLVFELAGQLTFKLSDSQPRIRVLFLPAANC
jgi:hypothetical protein